MKCINNTSEIEYYNEIINFYIKNLDCLVNDMKNIDEWTDYSYIRLMKDLKNEKKLIDAEIPHVVRNSIVLILCLFSRKCRRNPFNSLEDFSEEERREIKKLMLKAIDAM